MSAWRGIVGSVILLVPSVAIILCRAVRGASMVLVTGHLDRKSVV